MISAMLMGAVSCGSDGDEAIVEPADAPVIEDNTTVKKAMTFKAGSEGADKSLQKTAYDADLKMIWLSADNFSIFPANTDENAEYTLTSGEGTNSCEISGTSAEADDYFAMYPYNGNVAYSEGKFTGIEIPANQEVSAGQFDPKADILVGYSTKDDMSFQFRHIGSKLGVTVPIDGVKSIEISCSEIISGFVDVSMDANPDAIPAVTGITDECNTITLICEDPEGFVKGNTYYATVIPTSNPSSLKLTFYTDDDKKAGMYFNGKIAIMYRNTRNMAAPPVSKGKILCTLESLNKEEHFPKDATKIVFGYKKDYDVSAFEKFPDTWGSIEFYKNGSEYYILSDNEICLNGSLFVNGQGMFHNYDVTDIILTNFNTENVTDMTYMFYFCTQLTELDLSGFNTGNVTDMGDMFSYCWALTNLNITSFDTRNVEFMGGMFTSCEKLTTLDLSSFDTENVNDMSSMFDGCFSLQNIYVSTDFVVSEWCNDQNMFSDCENLPGYWDSWDPSTGFITDKTMAYIGGYFKQKP